MKERATLSWLWEVSGKTKFNVAFLIFFEALHGATGVVYALLLRGVVDSAVDTNREGFVRFLVLLVGLVIFRIALHAIIRYVTELSSATLENKFKSRLFDTLLTKDYASVAAVHSGTWLNRLTSDTVVVARSAVDIAPGLVETVVKLIGTLVMLIALEPMFAALVIPVGMISVVLTFAFRKRLKRMHKEIQEANGKLRIYLQERLSNLLMVRSFVAEDLTQRTATELMEEHQATRMRRVNFSNMCSIGFSAVMNGLYILGIAWCGYGILIGSISFGTLTAITQLISQLQSPFANITGYIPRYYSMTASAERLREAELFLGKPQDEKSLNDALDFYTRELSAFGLRDVNYSYLASVLEDVENLAQSEMPEALSELSLEVRKGEFVAFTGHSGCGKSTALKLLMCVYAPDSGERYAIREDGSQFELTSAWRRLFAYVPQGNQLMSGTIREVVSFAAPEQANNDEKLSHALKIACADDFVQKLEHGVETLLGERGTSLSEGQMQRLAIARAIFSGRPILLLDEVTSALDAQTETDLLANIRKMTDTTVIIVTHRPAALEYCDRVLHFSEQGVIEQV